MRRGQGNAIFRCGAVAASGAGLAATARLHASYRCGSAWEHPCPRAAPGSPREQPQGPLTLNCSLHPWQVPLACQVAVVQWRGRRRHGGPGAVHMGGMGPRDAG